MSEKYDSSYPDLKAVWILNVRCRQSKQSFAAKLSETQRWIYSEWLLIIYPMKQMKYLSKIYVTHPLSDRGLIRIKSQISTVNYLQFLTGTNTMVYIKREKISLKHSWRHKMACAWRHDTTECWIVEMNTCLNDECATQTQQDQNKTLVRKKICVASSRKKRIAWRRRYAL